MALTYQRASVVLSTVPDPARPAAEGVARNKQLIAASTEGKAIQAWQGAVITAASAAVPYAGPILAALWTIFDAVGAEIQKSSSGGFDRLPLLVKQRGLIYGVLSKEPTKDSFYRMQRFEVIPERAVSEYTDAEYEKYVRQYLVTRPRGQQWDRIRNTPDEPMLPVEAINKLYNMRLWPPPLEPWPLTVEDWRRSYDKYAKWTIYTNAIDLRRKAINEKVYRQLLTEYAEDAQLYRKAIADVAWTPDMIALAATSDMMPPLGTLANPQPAPESRASRF